MKRAVLASALIVLSVLALAQVPESFNYQAIPRNTSGGVYPDQAMKGQFSILAGNPTGSPVYVETFSAATSSLGILNLQIGTGTPVSGNFTTIDWGSNSYYLKVEIDVTGGTSYVEMGTTQMLSVPYAMHAKTVENEIQDLSDVLMKGTDAGNRKIVNVNQLGIGTVAPNASSALEISSTTQGFLPPRITPLQRNAITPVEGLIIYNTSTGKPNYYNGFEWMNFDGTSADTIEIGFRYKGGIIFYILQSGDPGYDADEPHGLIATTADQGGINISWSNGSFIATGATATELGTGYANTNTIITVQGAGTYAAQICADLVLNDYSDWYLPSKDELNLLYLNKSAVGEFENSTYWSSTESGTTQCCGQNFGTGVQVCTLQKDSGCWVRPIRSF